MLKYIILDEIALALIVDEEGDVKLFENKEKAIEYAQLNISGWQIIEIPFN